MTAKQIRKQASMPDEIMIMIWLDYQPYTRYSGCLPFHDSPTYRRSTPSHGLIACQFYQWSLECNRWYEAFNDRVPHKFSCTDYHTGGQYTRGWLNRFLTSNNIELFFYLVSWIIFLLPLQSFNWVFVYKSNFCKSLPRCIF